MMQKNIKQKECTFMSRKIQIERTLYEMEKLWKADYAASLDIQEEMVGCKSKAKEEELEVRLELIFDRLKGYEVASSHLVRAYG